MARRPHLLLTSARRRGALNGTGPVRYISTVTRPLMLMVSWLALGCGPMPTTPTAPLVPQDDTSLGAGDVFDVRVFGEEELSDTYRVAQDGSFDYPFVGRIEVQGLQPEAVAQTIASRLREGDLLRNPQVSVFVREYNSKKINVMGEVENAGTFTMTSGMTVVQAISLAGGFTSIAQQNGTVVTRRVDGAVRRFTVPVQTITEGRAEDFPLQAGDTVYVPQRVF